MDEEGSMLQYQASICVFYVVGLRDLIRIEQCVEGEKSGESGNAKGKVVDEVGMQERKGC